MQARPDAPFAAPVFSSALGSEAALAVAKALAGAVVLAAGFVALSDDDFSRVVIAQRFAAHPTLDPSGTSWLPLPFWITGTAMIVFGRSLSVARAVAIVSGVVSVILVHRAARALGASRLGAFSGALVAASIPTSARLGVAFQPEALAAGLVLYAVGAAGKRSGKGRLLGAFAVAAAALCRYEAWPIATVFALYAIVDSVRGIDVRPRASESSDGHFDPAASPRRRREASRTVLLLSGAVALAAPAVWMLHGVAAHHDALFFLHRVAAYRRALGVAEPPLRSILAYPAALVFTEPEIAIGGAVAFLAASRVPARARALRRPAVFFVGLLFFLVIGRVADGAPTHHSERPLLPIFYALSLAVGEAASAVLAGTARSRRAFVGAATVAILAGISLRKTSPKEAETPRTDERAIGRAARAAIPDGARLAVDTPDYGFFAVIAAFGAPERAEPLDRHDPREPKPEDAFQSAETFRRRLAALHADFLVVSDEHLPVAMAIGDVIARGDAFSLIRLRGAAP